MTTQPFHIRFAVDGLINAGTTTIINMVDAINKLENRGRSNMMPQIRLHLLPRAREQWKIVLLNKVGVIVVVDSAAPERFPDVKAMLHTIHEQCDIPLIILANKQDHPQALSTEALRKELDLRPHVLILPCVAQRMSSIMGVVKELVNWATAET